MVIKQTVGDAKDPVHARNAARVIRAEGAEGTEGAEQ